MTPLICRALERSWASGILPEPRLEVPHLLAAAVRAERRQPQGGSWEEALRRLSDDLQHTARLNALGRTIAHGLLVRTLRQRIRAERLWARHPDIARRPIERPVIILGQMRSGTTRLHRLLACDEQFAHTRLYETLQPVSRTRATAALSSALLQRFIQSCNPALAKIHPTGARAPEEEFGLHAFSFHGAMFEAQWDVPNYARWSESRSLTSVYCEFRRLLQTLAWRRRDRHGTVQLLKAPQFMQDLPEVFRSFPDARVILTSRDRNKVVASSASLVWNQRRIQSDQAQPVRIGAECLRKTQLRDERASAALRAHPAIPVLELGYDSVERDWLSAIRRIYDFLGMRLPEHVIAKMQRVATARAHRGHHYSERDFGLA